MSLFGKKRQNEVESARQMAIKLTLSKEVASSIKKLQRDHISTDSAIRSGDTANRFCNVMEAILLHELKDSYSTKTFWTFLIKFTHRDVLEQIKSLSFIKTEIGYCRAWVRLALNDCLMESYVAAILRDSKTVKQYYSRNSFFRDQEQPFIIRNYLQGLSNFSFQLSYNSNLLNVWGAAPSMLKGSWSPPNESHSSDTASPGPANEADYSSSDWTITSGALTSADMGFPIEEASLQVTPSSSLGTPQQRQTSSFHESELSSNLLRSLADEEEQKTKEAGDQAATGNRVDPKVIVEDSEDFEDSVVIHLSPTEPSSPLRPDRSVDKGTDKILNYSLSDPHARGSDSSNPFGNEDSASIDSPAEGVGNAFDVRSDAPPSQSDERFIDPSPFVVGGEGVTPMERSWEEGDDLNPFFQGEPDRDAEASEQNSKIPSLMDELQVAGVDDMDAGHHTKYDDNGDEMMEGEMEKEKSGCEDLAGMTKNRSQGADKSLEMSEGEKRGTHHTDGGSEKEEGFTSSFGNSLGAYQGWSSDFPNTHKPTTMAATDATDGYSKQESYQSVLKNYMDTADRVIAPVSNLSPLTSASSEGASEGNAVPSHKKSPPPSSPQANDLPLDFEIIPFSSSPASKYADMRTQELLSKVTTIANEKGLDSQNYQCKGCTRPVGIIYGKAKVCGYDGCYYCYECHVDEESIIPARILHSWDFRKQKVAKHTKSFLQQVEAMPLIDISEANPSLYKAVPELEEVKKVRMQLKYLKAYLFTCKQSVAEELKKRVWPREYMLDHVHLYSMLDCSQVQAGTLAPILNKVVVFAVKHVQQCALCSQKGFICEICENSKIIYPFDTDLTIKCERCKAVYHRACKTEMKPCPKCVRRKVRQNQMEQTTSQAESFVSPFT